MQKRILIAAALLVGAGTAMADNITERSVGKARALIDKAVEAHGGAEALNGIESFVVRHETINIASGQSRGTTAPWDRNEASGFDAVNTAERTYANRNSGYGGGFEFDQGQIIEGDAGFQLNYRAGTATKLEGVDADGFMTRIGPFVRVSPPLLLRQAASRAQSAHYLGKTELDGRQHHVVAFSMAVGPAISLYLDSETYRLNASERVIPGFGLIAYRFGDYEVVDGVLVNRTFRLLAAGEPNMERRNVSTSINGSLAAFTQVDADLDVIPAAAPAGLSSRELADGVWHIGGNGTYAMFVDMGEYIVAVGGTAGIPDRIAELRKTVDKPIRYGVMTHHHSDHVLGAAPYADAGITVVAAQAHAQVMRTAAGERENFALETVGKRKRVLKGDNGRRLEIIDIGPTPHTEHFLLAYLPKEQIIFEADHFAMPQTGPVAPAVSGTVSFADALKKHRIKASTIASAHSPRPGTAADLANAVERGQALLRASAD